MAKSKNCVTVTFNNMTVNRSEYGTIRLPVDIIATISTILNDVLQTQQDIMLKRSIERDPNMRLCGLEPGEYDQVTVRAYLTLVDLCAMGCGQTLEELTRAAFKVYMGLRKSISFGIFRVRHWQPGLVIGHGRTSMSIREADGNFVETKRKSRRLHS